MSAGSRSALSAPFDGERRLISLITASSPAAARARSAAANSRAGGAPATASASASSGRVSTAAAARWRATIASRYVAAIGSEALAADGGEDVDPDVAAAELPDRGPEGPHRLRRSVGAERGGVGVLLVEPHHVGVLVVGVHDVAQRALLGLHGVDHRLQRRHQRVALAGLGLDAGDHGNG